MSAADDSGASRAMVSMPDPHGQAALLLVESLIHGLLARSVIGIHDAIDIAEAAASVQFEVAEAADGAGAPMWQSHGLLNAIIESLRHDDGGNPSPPRSFS